MVRQTKPNQADQSDFILLPAEPGNTSRFPFGARSDIRSASAPCGQPQGAAFFH